jgi:hypothetical protein
MVLDANLVPEGERRTGVDRRGEHVLHGQVELRRKGERKKKS